MIDVEKARELKALAIEARERFDFGGLPMPEIFDTLEALWKVAHTAEKLLETASPGETEAEQSRYLETVSAFKVVDLRASLFALKSGSLHG